MITEQYVSFETAGLLQSKGFKEEQSRYYRVEDETIIGSRWIVEREGLKKSKDFDERYIQCPTQSLTMRWLREVHNLFIWVTYHIGSGLNWSYEIHNIKVGKTLRSQLVVAGSYETCVENAIKYCLENLI